MVSEARLIYQSAAAVFGAGAVGVEEERRRGGRVSFPCGVDLCFLVRRRLLRGFGRFVRVGL